VKIFRLGLTFSLSCAAHWRTSLGVKPLRKCLKVDPLILVPQLLPPPAVTVGDSFSSSALSFKLTEYVLLFLTRIFFSAPSSLCPEASCTSLFSLPHFYFEWFDAPLTKVLISSRTLLHFPLLHRFLTNTDLTSLTPFEGSFNSRPQPLQLIPGHLRGSTTMSDA